MKPACLFNPSFQDPAAPSPPLAVRQPDLQAIQDHVQSQASSPSPPRHLLVLGASGEGKSFLIERTAQNSLASPPWTASWRPMALPQDAGRIAGVRDLLLYALEMSLGPQAPEVRQAMSDPSWGAARDMLRGHSRSTAKGLLFLMDNMDELCARFPEKDLAELAALLADEPWILAAATARTSSFPGFSRRFSPLFTVHVLESLSLSDCQALCQSATGQAPSPAAMLASRVLAGGNLRMTAFLGAMEACHGPLSVPDLALLLADFHTPWHTGQVHALPSAERKIFSCLASLWRPATALETGNLAGWDVNKASSLLNRLAGRGMVGIAARKGRVQYYQVSGPMNNLCCLLRSGRTSRDKAQGFFRFLEALCPEPGESAPVQEASRHEPARASAPPFPAGFPEAGAAPPREGPRPQEPGDSSGWVELAKTLEEEGLSGDAARAYQKAVDLRPDHAWAWARLARLLHEDLDRFQEAETAYLQAIEADANLSWAWCALGRLLHEKLHNYVEAEQAFRIAVELEPHAAGPRVLLGRLHEKLERHQSALRAYQEAAQVDPENPEPYAAMGALHQSQGRSAEAEAAYARARDCRPVDAPGWIMVGRILETQFHMPEKALTAYNEARRTDPAHYPAWEALFKLQARAFQSPDMALATAASYLEARDFSRGAVHNLRGSFSKPPLSPLNAQLESLLAQAPGASNPAPPPHAPSARREVPRPPAPEQPSPPATCQELLNLVEGAPEDAPLPASALRQIVCTAIALAANGKGREVLDILAAREGEACLAPLSAGVRLHVGQELMAAPEILETARILVEQITRRPSGS